MKLEGSETFYSQCGLKVFVEPFGNGPRVDHEIPWWQAQLFLVMRWRDDSCVQGFCCRSSQSCSVGEELRALLSNQLNHLIFLLDELPINPQAKYLLSFRQEGVPEKIKMQQIKYTALLYRHSESLPALPLQTFSQTLLYH